MNCTHLSPMPEAAGYRRTPDTVMRLARLGVSHPTRLSFLRILLRRMQQEAWEFTRPVFDLDARGVGRAVYCAKGPDRTYSLVAFGHDLDPDMRSDRVIATAWDATFCLYDGVPGAAELDRLADNVPVQEAGRVTSKELILSRANRSVRLFQHVVDALSKGRQPDASDLAATGYLMRTTAVYGSGKFGAASFASIADRPEVSAPFQAEMLTVWLIRTFTVDLVEHIARSIGGETAVTLDPALKRGLGVGNSTGLGMAPFLVHHPILLNNWMMVREEALARVRAQNVAGEAEIHGFRAASAAARENADTWQSEHPIQVDRLSDLRQGLAQIATHIESEWRPEADHPWDALWTWGETHLTNEAQEALLSLMLEPHGALIDGLATCLQADEASAFTIKGAATVGEVLDLFDQNYAWALRTDYADKSACARFWYVSEDKLEPRLGERFEEPGGGLELPLDIGRRAAALWASLQTRPRSEPISRLLLAEPNHRIMVRRVQMTRGRPFAEIRDNLIASEMLPIDMLRCKLAFFGATRFDPRSDRWVRISLFQNCPYPDTLIREGIV
ncbi:hypothetical protein [uncultured Roseibium sp.]|uniref:hypothetical protein n=1 Tax=uncultured Roseibium sp. TaxID=1936171 RepID=UPI0025950F30|nr:hypothetical protein [uncultured Roseibium sp.]